MKFLHLNYHHHEEFNTPKQVVNKHAPSSGFVQYLKHKVDFISVKHLNYEGELMQDHVEYRFFESRNHSWYIPWKTHQFIKKAQPDVILIEGFVFPLQVIFLRRAVGSSCRIVLQHHGERPFRGVKKLLQKIADRFVNAYTFTALGNSLTWISEGVIRDRSKCREVLSASSDMTPLDKKTCRKFLDLPLDENIFLWVGRLNINKDPLTVLTAFSKYLSRGGKGKLFFIYQADDFLTVMRSRCASDPLLNDAVTFVGKKEKRELQFWYSASDYYLSASRREGSGYALVEAMCCGSLPIVTNIPSFNKITAGGIYGLLFEAGNTEELSVKLLNASNSMKEDLPSLISQYAANQLSSEAIAEQFYSVAMELTRENQRMTVAFEPGAQHG